VRTFTISANDFDRMGWVVAQGGADATIYASRGAQNQVRVATQMLSEGRFAFQDRFAYIGWRQFADGWRYLHKGGALGATDTLQTSVELDSVLERFDLPDKWTEAELTEAVRASVRLLVVAKLTITAPTFAAIWASVLGSADFSCFLLGPTGAKKSTCTALAQAHFGRSFTIKTLPLAWGKKVTLSGLEGTLNSIKDAICTIDDFRPPRDHARIVGDAATGGLRFSVGGVPDRFGQVEARRHAPITARDRLPADQFGRSRTSRR
jgi:hypothetical protein